MASVSYRATVYGLDGAVLTPISGAPHSLAFQVATREGIAGYQPYLEIPRGRHGKLDPLKKTTDTGELTLSLLDKRLADSSNLERFVTAYFGDAEGRERLKGCKLVLEQDAGSGFQTYFTGRIYTTRVRGKVWADLVVRDLAEDQNHRIFQGLPHKDVASYATYGNLIPTSRMVNAWGNVGGEAGLRATLKSPPTGAWTGTAYAGAMLVDIQDDYVQRSAWWLRVITQDLADLILGFKKDSRNVRIRAKYTSGTYAGQEGEFLAANPYAPDLSGIWSARDFSVKGRPSVLQNIGIKPLPNTDPKYLPLGSAGDKLVLSIHGGKKPTKGNPLWIQDVHAVQLWKDILLGKFGPFKENGDPSFPIAMDTAAFDALIADPSIPKIRLCITEDGKMNEWVEKYICKIANLSWYLDASGQVVPVDLRIPKALPAGAATNKIVDADLAEDADVDWSVSRASQITRVEVKVFQDILLDRKDPAELYTGDEEFPAARSVPIKTVDHLYIPANLREEAAARGAKPYQVEALGFRYMDQEQTAGMSRADWVQRQAQTLANHALGPFGNGAQMVTTTVRRDSTNAGSVMPGTWKILNLTERPNLASNKRGGERLCLCVGREEDGPVVHLDWIDAGPGTVATSPTLGPVSLVTGREKSSVKLDVTLNAATEPVLLEMAVTAVGGARPAEDSDLWTFASLVTASAVGHSIAGLPAGKRIHVRGRTEGTQGEALKLPSPWIAPSTTAYADTTALPTPSGTGVSSITKTTAVLTWTNADTALPLQVLLYQGTVAPTWGDEHVILDIPPGSNRAFLENLSGPSVGYFAGVRYLDDRGVPGGVSQVSFTTGSTDPQAPVPVGLALATPISP